MESTIITGKSKKDIQLLITLAGKMGLTGRFVTEDDLEDFGIANAIIEGKTRELVDTNEFLKGL